MRSIAVESTTRSVSSVRRALTRRPSTVVRDTTLGWAGSATSSSTITVVGTAANGEPTRSPSMTTVPSAPEGTG